MTSCELVKSSGFYDRNGIGYDSDRIAIGEYYFMNSLTITVPETTQAYIDEQIANGHYMTAGELVTFLIEEAQERQAKQKVNTMLRSTIQKNKTTEATDEWWEKQREQLIQQLPS